MSRKLILQEWPALNKLVKVYLSTKEEPVFGLRKNSGGLGLYDGEDNFIVNLVGSDVWEYAPVPPVTTKPPFVDQDCYECDPDYPPPFPEITKVNSVNKKLARRAQEGFKDGNPKDVLGSSKLPFSCVPMTVLSEMAVGMGEGAIKYGKHNWRVEGVRASIYFDATLRHLISWFEGEDLDPDTGVNHIAKAITSLAVLRDSMIQGNWVDDRPPAAVNKPIQEGNVAFKAAKEKHTDCGLHYDRESIRKRNNDSTS